MHTAADVVREHLIATGNIGELDTIEWAKVFAMIVAIVGFHGQVREFDIDTTAVALTGKVNVTKHIVIVLVNGEMTALFIVDNTKKAA